MNILFVTQFFYPENFRINDLATSLISRGHKVTVLTGIPNYPGGEYYEGYNSKPFEENYNGVRIVRTYVRPRKKGSLNLCLNYLSFVIHGTKGAKKLLKAGESFDAIYAFGTSPITQAIPAISIKKKTGTGIVLNVQDLWPDNVVAITGIKNKAVVFLLDKLVDYIYNKCDYVLGTSGSFVKAISSRRGLKIPKENVKFWPQYSVVEKSEENRPDLMRGNKRHIAFTGNIGDGQGLDMVLGVAKRIKKNNISNIEFNLFGDGRAKEKLMQKSLQDETDDIVKFHGSFPEKEIPSILNSADMALIILNNNPIFEKTIPAKLQTYLACGCAVMGCVTGESASLIKDNNIGICADTVSEDGLYGAVIRFLKLTDSEIDEYKQNSLKLANERFNKEFLINELEEYLEIISLK